MHPTVQNHPTTPNNPAVPAITPLPVPLWIVLVVSFLNSVGTGIVTSGIYYLTQQGYAFSQTMNYVLGFVIGATYIGGSLAAQPSLAWIRRRFPSVSTRGVLVGLMVVMAGLCCSDPRRKTRPPGRVHGRRRVDLGDGRDLQPALGRAVADRRELPLGCTQRRDPAVSDRIWNVTWSAAPWPRPGPSHPRSKTTPRRRSFCFGELHLLCVPFFRLLSRGACLRHQEDRYEPHPPVYAALLVTFRDAAARDLPDRQRLSPYLPQRRAHRTRRPPVWHTILGMPGCSRAIAFFVLMHWQGWHGKWSTAIVSGVLVVAGFGVAVMAPTLPRLGLSNSTSVVVLVAGLAVFGLGKASVYTAALYYGLAVGKSEVQAGGKHEALIGCGYTLGPACGLAATAAVSSGIIGPTWFNAAVLGTVGALTFGVAFLVLKRVRHMSGTRATRHHSV